MDLAPDMQTKLSLYRELRGRLVEARVDDRVGGITEKSSLDRMIAIIDESKRTNIPARIAISSCPEWAQSIATAIAHKYSVPRQDIALDAELHKLPASERPENHWSYEPRTELSHRSCIIMARCQDGIIETRRHQSGIVSILPPHKLYNPLALGWEESTWAELAAIINESEDTESLEEKLGAAIGEYMARNIPARIAVIELNNKAHTDAATGIARRYGVSDEEVLLDKAVHELPAHERPVDHWAYIPRAAPTEPEMEEVP